MAGEPEPIEYATLADIRRCFPIPEYPKVTKRGLQVNKDTTYRIPNDPVKAIGLFQHLAGKGYLVNDQPNFMFYAITRTVKAKGWNVHPF